MENKFVKTGFTEFDKELYGLEKGHVILLAGRPSMGKSAFAISLIDNICQRNEGGCIYFTADNELQVPRLCDRLATAHMWNIVADEKFGDDQTNRRKAFMDIDKYNLVLLDAYFDNIELRIQWFMDEIEKDPVKIIVIDGLQKLCTNASGWLDRRKMHTELARFKGLAKEKNCPILVTSDLKRTVEKRKDHHPEICDIYGLSDPLSLVDDIILLYRDDYYDNMSKKPDIAEIFHISTRSKRVTNIEFGFSHKYARFL